jgi:pimeloyl-ACP methyl ester carboxylesterase
VQRYHACNPAQVCTVTGTRAKIYEFAPHTIDNEASLAQNGKLNMPMLALGGEKSFGSMMATVMRAAAEDVQEGIVPDSGHWIMEENPQATVAMVRAFLDAGK